MDINQKETTWSDQNAMGRLKAKELIDRMQTKEAPVLLGYAVQAMIARGVYGGVEVGFFHHISIRLMKS